MEDRPRCVNLRYRYDHPNYCPLGPYANPTLDKDGLCGSCCVEGKRLSQRMRELDTNDISFARKLKELCELDYEHAVAEHGAVPRAKHNGNGAPQGAFAFTLTASPSDGKTEADYVAAVRKVMNQRSCPVKRYAWYLEYGNEQEKTHPHIHGMYETESGGVIEKKHWKRAWNIWDPSQRLGAGFRGGYHRPVRHDECYNDYIRKQKNLGESRNASQDDSPPPPPPSPQEEADQTSPVDA